MSLGVVVTADCDIAHSKHRGILSYVFVLHLADYIRLFHFRKLIERNLRPVVDELTKQIRDLQRENRPDFPEPVSEAGALRWIVSSEPTEIAEELGLPEGKHRTRFLALADVYRSARVAKDGEQFEEQFTAITRMRSQSPTPSAEAKTKLWTEIAALVRDLPGDAFFLGRLTATLSSGYVAYLRLVREISDEQIAIRYPALAADSGAVAKRIARLRSPYIFRLTQQLSDVFAAIALPTEYETHRKRLVEQMASAGTDAVSESQGQGA